MFKNLNYISKVSGIYIVTCCNLPLVVHEDAFEHLVEAGVPL